ncbi:hypothetical protein HYT24_02895 [Candidatus Pacearchaeota archaeon]|nr:hypothetical protein [Candidatus Pacearchaeota archaeon]
MKRRDLFRLVGGIGAAAVIPSQAQANVTPPVEPPYEEPFPGYNEYVDRLKKAVGNQVSVWEGFGGSDRKNLTGIERFEGDGKLFPHRVSFGDGSAVNLKNLVGILPIDGGTLDIFEDRMGMQNPQTQLELYLNVPARRAFNQGIKAIIDRDYNRRYGKD